MKYTDKLIQDSIKTLCYKPAKKIIFAKYNDEVIFKALYYPCLVDSFNGSYNKKNKVIFIYNSGILSNNYKNTLKEMLPDFTIIVME